MNRKILLIAPLVFFMFFVLSSTAAFAIPQYFDFSETPATNSFYSFGASYTFYINWTNTTENEVIDNVTFKTNFTGSDVTYNSSSTPAVVNITGGTPIGFANYSISFTDLPAGNYFYEWTATNNNSESNTTTVIYSVAKAPLMLSLSGSNVTYPTSVSIIPSESNFGDTDVNYTFYRNDTGLISFSNGTAPSSVTSVLPAGNYQFILNATSGPFANYTENTTGVSRNIYVARANPSLSFSYSPGQTVTEGVTTTVNCSATSLNNEVPTPLLTRSPGSSGGNPDQSFLSPGTYTYNCSTLETPNYNTTFKIGTLTVNSISSGSSSSSSSATADFKIVLSTTSLSANTSSSKSTSLNISNTLGYDLINPTLTITGIPSSWYTFSPTITKFPTDAILTMTLTFNIPSNATAGNNALTITASGNQPNSNNIRTATKNMTLTVASNPVTPSNTTNDTRVVTNNTTVQPNNTQSETAVPTGFVLSIPNVPSNVIGIVAIIIGGIIFVSRNQIKKVFGLSKKSGYRYKPEKKKGYAALSFILIFVFFIILSHILPINTTDLTRTITGLFVKGSSVFLDLLKKLIVSLLS